MQYPPESPFAKVGRQTHGPLSDRRDCWGKRTRVPPTATTTDAYPPCLHVSLLEPYKESRFAGHTQARPPPVEVEGELEYEVKEIVDSKVVRGKLQYHVEWVGYGPEERTWEPVEHVGHAAEAITEYHRSYPNRPSPRDLPQPPRRRSRRQVPTNAA